MPARRRASLHSTGFALAMAITVAALDPMAEQEVEPLLDVMRRLLSGFKPPDTGSAPPRQP